MKPDPQALYISLGSLVATMPDLTASGPITPEMYQWMGRASALIEVCAPLADMIAFNVATQNLDTTSRDRNAQTIAAVLHRALARAELAAPAETQGAFIPVGSQFSAISALSKVLGNARRDALIVDPYADARVLTDFAVLAPETVSIRVLADAQSVKPSLAPAMASWHAQYGVARPLEIRLASARSLHDRLIIVDDVSAWTLTQSLKDFASRSPASIVKMTADTVRLKIEACADIWKSGLPFDSDASEKVRKN